MTTKIDVEAHDLEMEQTEGFSKVITPRDVETSAGTFGDPSRFMQTLAGVVSDSDQRNDVLVRGGNPNENLFIVDNIEIPSINHLALSDTTGGLVSMLDAEAMQRITLHDDTYDSKFEQRLSSVIEISTRPHSQVGRHSTAELGFSGAGGSITRPFGLAGSFFLSARQGVLQYVTNDIGLNGVPKYRNSLIRAENKINDQNNWWAVSLTGIDSIKIRPSANDSAETNPYDIDYSGWRTTTGFNWQHGFSARAFGVASIAHAEQSQSLQQTDQLQGDATVYNEKTRDGVTTLKYDWVLQPNSSLTLTTGGRAAVDQLNYSVAQPIGLRNPYSTNPEPLNAGAMQRQFATVSSAAYAQAAIRLPHGALLVLGERGMQWALGGQAGSSSKALFAVPVYGKLVHFGFSQYEQLAPTLYLLSFNNLRTLKPIRSYQWTTGIALVDGHRIRTHLDAYEKHYLDYPVSADFPGLSMANVSDTFGQVFLMFPMVAKGKGIARGVELTVETHVTNRLDLTGTLSYARSWYSGLDGILRRGNFDLPITSNVIGMLRLPHNTYLSWRYGIASGRPYTPYNMTLATAQNRDVYDLSKINGVRSSAYQRLDFRFEQAIKFGHATMTWHVGLLNATGHKNFYALVWQPRIGEPIEEHQLPRFPDGGIKFSF